MRRSRPSIVGVLVVLTLAACGQDTAIESTSSTTPAGSVADRLVAATERIVDDWGDREGFARLLLAVDAGYSLTQIVSHPSLTEHGTVEGADPDGEPLGLLEDPPASTSGRAPTPVFLAMVVAQAPSWSAAETYVGFIDDTVGDLFDAAHEHIRTAREAEQEELEWEQAVTTVTAALLARGYSAEQVIEALILDDAKGITGLGGISRRPTACYTISTDPPTVPPGSDLLEGECAPISSGVAPSTTTVASTTTTVPPGTQPEGGGDHYVGSVDAAGTGADPSLVVDNRVDLIAGEDMTGLIVLLGNATIEGFEDSEGFCFYLRVDLEPGAVPAIGEGTYAGSAQAVGGLGETTCVDGPPTEGLTSTPVSVEALVSDGTLTGSVGNAGEEPITFTATLTP
jgi:hypothetical protein